MRKLMAIGLVLVAFFTPTWAKPFPAPPPRTNASVGTSITGGATSTVGSGSTTGVVAQAVSSNTRHEINVRTEDLSTAARQMLCVTPPSNLPSFIKALFIKLPPVEVRCPIYQFSIFSCTSSRTSLEMP